MGNCVSAFANNPIPENHMTLRDRDRVLRLLRKSLVYV